MSDAQNARSEILTRIRSAVCRSAPEMGVEQAWEAIPRNYIQTGRLSSNARIGLLYERLRDYGAGVFASRPSLLRSAIAEMLQHRIKKQILVPPDIHPDWLPRTENVCAFISDDALSYTVLDRCDGVLTGCNVAIAETGTLCLVHGERGNGRRALTLIPDYHLCVVHASEVVSTVPEAIRALEPYKTQPITLISGPSATADIEMTRIQGVHGPRVLDVIIVDQELSFGD